MKSSKLHDKVCDFIQYTLVSHKYFDSKSFNCHVIFYTQNVLRINGDPRIALEFVINATMEGFAMTTLGAAFVPMDSRDRTV